MKIVRYLSKITGIYLAFLLQSLIFENIKIFSCSPDILVTAIIICAVSTDFMKAASLGAFAGLLLDAICGRVFGVNILIYMYLAFFVSTAVSEKTENSPLLMSWVVFITITALEISVGVLKSMLGYHSSVRFILTSIFVKGIFGALFTLFFVLIYHKIKKRIIKATDSVGEDAV